MAVDVVDQMLSRDIQSEIDAVTKKRTDNTSSPYESFDSSYTTYDTSGMDFDWGGGPKGESSDMASRAQETGIRFNKIKDRHGRTKILATDREGRLLTNVDKGSESLFRKGLKEHGLSEQDLVWRGDEAKYLHGAMTTSEQQQKSRDTMYEKELQALQIDLSRQGRLNEAMSEEDRLRKELYGDTSTGDIGDAARFGMAIDKQLDRGLSDLEVRGEEAREGLGGALSTTGMSRSTMAQKGFEDIEMAEVSGRAQIRAGAESQKENIGKQKEALDRRLKSMDDERRRVLEDAAQGALYDEVMKEQMSNMEQMYKQLETNAQINQAEAEAHRALIGNIFKGVAQGALKIFGV